MCLANGTQFNLIETYPAIIPLTPNIIYRNIFSFRMNSSRRLHHNKLEIQVAYFKATGSDWMLLVAVILTWCVPKQDKENEVLFPKFPKKTVSLNLIT